MKILIVGNGGREHAIGNALKRSCSENKLSFLPGNGGTLEIGENIEININDIDSIVDYSRSENIELVVIGPEQPLVDGLANELRKYEIPVFGPNSEAAIIEGEKSFSKCLMKKYKIPTAEYEIFHKNEHEKAINYLETRVYPIVIKADGLAAGKGVVICNSFKEAKNELVEYFQHAKFGVAGEKIIIEEFLVGEEVSIFALTDGKKYYILPSSQDHKRLFDNDEGPNTGGMGAYSPSRIITQDLISKIENMIIIPTLKAMETENRLFSGCLYCGLIIDNNEPKVIEFNARLGDPETESVLSLIEGRFDKLLLSIALGKIDSSEIQIKNEIAINVVIVSKGYPNTYEKGKEITIIDKFSENVDLFHMGTKLENGKLVTSGGRVLSLNVTAPNLELAVKTAYENISKIQFEGMFYRTDIAAKAKIK